MNQDEVIKTLSEKNGLAPELNQKVVDGFLAIITDSLVKGSSIKMTGFGTFDVFIGNPRLVTNPRTFEIMEMGHYARPSFRAGRALKASIKNSLYLHEKMKEEEVEKKEKKQKKSISFG